MKEKTPIIIDAGNIHISNVSSASGMPPRFSAISITVWVEDGPGSI
jgi:membrane-bound inhibitor of C-type lysozyme